MSFKTYVLNEKKQSPIQKIITERKKIISRLKKLEKYIAKDYKKTYAWSLKMLDPKLLEKIEPLIESDINENKILQRNITGLVNVMEAELALPGYGPQVEKVIKKDYENLCDGLAGIVFAKIDPKLIMNENVEFLDESRGGLIGATTGGVLGLIIGGPIGALLGAAIGGSAGEENTDVIDKGIDAIGAGINKIKNLDYKEIVLTAGTALGTFAGILTGTLPVAIAGGLVGMVLSEFLYNEVAVKGKVLTRTTNSTKKFTLAMYNKILDNSIYLQRRALAKKLKAQYKLRKI